MRNLKPGYYQFPNKKIVKVKYHGYNQVYGETLYGSRKDFKAKAFEKAVRINYRPTFAELWNLTKTRPFDKEQKKHADDSYRMEFLWSTRLEYFFTKLIEFDYIKIDTLGYYYKSSKDNKENVGESIAYKLNERFWGIFTTKNDACKRIKRHFLAWANNPTEENRKLLFEQTFSQGIVQLHTDHECPITGYRFKWACNGKIVKPAYRRLERQERETLVANLKKELAGLQKLKNPKPEEVSRRDILAEAFSDTDIGGMKMFNMTSYTEAVPFKKACADPATGEYPKAVVEIDVPTGKLVFANTLFKYLKDFEKEHDQQNSLNHTRGRNNNIYFHAKTNQAFFVPVGNNSPRVWQNKKTPSSLRIGRASDEPEKNEWGYVDAEKEWDDRGYICTDLWAFHACDRSRLPKRIAVDHFIVTVPTGRYRLTNHYEHEGYKTGIFCEIEKIDPQDK